MSPTSSVAMFLTGIPLTSRIWSPTCTERSVSLLRTAESNLWDNSRCSIHQGKTAWPSHTHSVTLTRGPVSWLSSVAMTRPRRPPAQGVKDTSATMCGLLVGAESDREEDTTPWRRQLPLRKRDWGQEHILSILPILKMHSFFLLYLTYQYSFVCSTRM